MARLTRAQQQTRTRVAVLAAAREEFVEYGYVPAKVDRIAERAELTRGAVYSNFPSKRALYLAVLVSMVESADPAPPPAPPGSRAAALGAFARTWLERLPLVDDTASGGRLQLRSLVGVVDDEPGRAVLAQVARLEALLLALGLESCEPGPEPVRQVRLAELALTLLGGSGLLAELAPGFGDPFDQTRACRHLAGLDLGDTWAPPYLDFVRPAETCHEAMVPPAGLVDLITGAPVDLAADGLVTVLGARRLEAAEEAVRAARPGEQVTVVVVTSDPAEIGGLVRLRISDLAACLRAVFPLDAWQRVRLVIEDGARAASAAGLTGTGDGARAGSATGLTGTAGKEASAFGVTGIDGTESAVLVRDGMIVARASGRGAAYAASADGSRSRGAGA